MENRAPIVLPAETYDFLKGEAEKYGGIGAGFFTEPYDTKDPNPNPCPVCAHGLVGVRYSNFDTQHGYGLNVHSSALITSGIRASVNDSAVKRINASLGRSWQARVSFEEWCVELNVVRAE